MGGFHRAGLGFQPLLHFCLVPAAAPLQELFSDAAARAYSSPVTALRGSGAALAGGGGRLRVVLQLVVERAAQEGSLARAPDALSFGLGWPVLALQMVLNAFGPECFEAHVVVTDSASTPMGRGGYFHHTESWPEYRQRREREAGERAAAAAREDEADALAAAAARTRAERHALGRGEGAGFAAVARAARAFAAAGDPGGAGGPAVARGSAAGEVSLAALGGSAGLHPATKARAVARAKSVAG